jgi:hypothetical protein
MIAPSEVGDIDIFHSVLSGGEPVLSAGTANILPTASGYVGQLIDDVSGHYEPPAILLRIGQEAFARIGITFERVAAWGAR